MARIRSVKPEFWTDSDVVACTPLARLLFMGTWNHADDYGVLKDDPAQLKLQILPADQCDAHALVGELVERRLLVRKVAPDGTRVLVIRSYCVHQKIDKRSPGRWGKPEDLTDPPEPTDPPKAKSAPRNTPNPNRSQPVPTGPAEAPPIPSDPHLGLDRTGLDRTLENTPAPAPKLALVPEPGSAPPVPVQNHLPRTLVETRPSRYPPEFESLWVLYPVKKGKDEAHAEWKRVRGRVTWRELHDGLNAQIAAWQADGTTQRYMPRMAKWLHGGHWADEHTEQSRPRAKSADAIDRVLGAS